MRALFRLPNLRLSFSMKWKIRQQSNSVSKMDGRFSLTELPDQSSHPIGESQAAPEVVFWLLKDEDIEKYLKVSLGNPVIPGLGAFVSKEAASSALAYMLSHETSSGNLGLRAVSFEAACEIVLASPVFQVLYIIQKFGMEESTIQYVMIPC